MDKDNLSGKEEAFFRLLREGKSIEEAADLLQLPSEVVFGWIMKLKLSSINEFFPQSSLEQMESRASFVNLALEKLVINTPIEKSALDRIIKTNAANLLNFHSDRNYTFFDELANKLSEVFSSNYQLFQASSEDVYHDNHAKAALPFVLKRIRIEGYHGIAQTSLENVPVNTQWIFLTGENGYGKTTLLQAIAIGLLGSKDGDNILVDDREIRISVEFKNNGQNTIQHLWIPFKPITSLAAYGSARLEIQNAQSQSQVEKHMATSYSLFNTDGVLQNIEFELYKWSLKGDKKFTAVRKLFKQLIPQLHDIKVDKERDEVLYIEKDAHGKAFEAVPFRKLASGFRSIIAMIGDMVIRLYKQQPEVINPQKLSGIVLIDEFDLHLHPKWQRELPVLLSTAFPLVQFIVSTHSVIPFLGAPPNSVFLKVTRDRKKGIEVQKLDIDIKNLLPNTILTSAIFDMDNITQRNNKDLAAVRTEDNFKEVLKNDEIQKKLKQFEESDADFPTDLFKEA